MYFSERCYSDGVCTKTLYLTDKQFILHGKGKGKGRLLVLQHCCLEVYCTLTRMISFIHLQRRCTHQAAWEKEETIPGI